MYKGQMQHNPGRFNNSKYFYLLISGLLISFAFSQKANSQEYPVWKVIEDSPVFLTSAIEGGTKIFSLNKGDEVKVLARDGTWDILVSHPVKGKGWVRFSVFNELRTLVYTDSADLYKRADFRDGTIGKVQMNDTAVLLEESENHAMFRIRTARGAEGWTYRSAPRPATIDNLPDKTDDNRIYRYDKIVNIVYGLSDSLIMPLLGEPTSVFNSEGSKVWFYEDFLIVKDKMHYSGIYLLFKDNQVVGDSLRGKGQKAWIERLPLASWIRGFSFPHYFSARNISLEPFFDKIAELGRVFSWIVTIVKFLILILLFSIPVLIAQYAFRQLIYIRLLPNMAVKILNYLVYYSVFYIAGLVVILNIGIQSPFFFTLIAIGSLYFITKYYKISTFNKKVIDYKRCNKCRTGKGVYQSAEIIDKKHKTVTNTWNQFMGSKTSYEHVGGTPVTVKTNYYQARSNTYDVTVFTYHDHCMCLGCSHRWFVTREQTKPGKL
ncbi:MAG: hypothetical protein HGA37_10685 [Lentimicrobium sp.]|nr:hypothetical protein [Lentimicrobium sp.]